MKSSNSTFTGIMLMVLLWLTYQILTAPTKEQLEQIQKTKKELADKKRREDSLSKLGDNKYQIALDKIKKDSLLTDAQKDSFQIAIKTQELGSKYGIFTAASQGQDAPAFLENEKFKITFNQKGGRITKVEVKNFTQYNTATPDPYDKEPLVLMNHPKNQFEYYIPLVGPSKGEISTADLYFEPKLEGNSLSLRAYASDRSKFIEQKYTIGDNYVLDYQLTLEGLDEVTPRDKKIGLNWSSYLYKIEKNPHYEATMTTVYYKSLDENFNYCDCRTTTSEELANPVQWVSQSQQFFNVSLFSKEGTTFANAKIASVVVDPKAQHLKELKSFIEFQPKNQKTATYDMKMYIGPNDYNELVAMGDEFERIIPFGWSIFGFISRSVIRPMFNFFAMFISNYGIVILLLTLLIRIAMFPLQYKMILNGVKMSVLKPEMEAMRNKYKDDPTGMQAAQMKMYQEYGLNPLGGCLPMLLTMPIWIALYRFFPSSIDFRHKTFLWADDLVSYDSILDFGELPVIYAIYGSHVSLFTLLWMVSMFVFVWYNSKQMDMSAAAGGNAVNMKMMMYMQYAFPVLFFFALNSWAAGLTIYMLFSNLLNIAQTYITKNILIDKDKLRAEMLEKQRNYKEKPQTGFMAKYQELLKEQQEAEKKRKAGGK